MLVRMIGILVAGVLVLFGATAAYAPYHTAPSPPATPPPAQPPGQPSGGSLEALAKTAATHAGFAGDGSTVSNVREHLGHTIVCIEGPRGKNVNAAWENPCQGQGNGVLNELRGPAVSWKGVAEAADGLAVRGIQSSNLAEMKAAGKGVSALMKLIAEAK